MRKILLALTGFLCLSTVLFSQRMVTGNVTGAEDGVPLPGVAVIEKGTTHGTTTDVNGNYALAVEPGATLSFTFVGMIPQEIEVGDQTRIDLAMETESIGIEDVIVIGYGTQRKSDVTGSISKVSPDNLVLMAVPNIEQALHGRAAGINITQADGNPGASMHVRIRGTGTTGNNDPLYIVDGVEVHSYRTVNAENEPTAFGRSGWPIAIKRVSGLDNINPNDIESIEILKDASASAIYGSRAANGVVLITTKRGKTGKPRIQFDAYQGWKQMPGFYDMMNTDDYMEYVNDAWATNFIFSKSPPKSFDDYAADPTQFNTYDWQDARYVTGRTQNYDLSVSGGNDFATYRISASSFDEQGVIPETWYDRITLRSNTEMTFGRFKFGQNIGVSRSHSALERYAWSRPALYYMPLMPPLIPIYSDEMDADGRWVESPDATGHTTVTPYYVLKASREPVNSILYQDLIDDKSQNDNFTGNMFAELKIIKGLSYRIDGKVTINKFNRQDWSPTWSIGTWTNQIAELSESFMTQESYTLDQLLNYKRDFGDHSVSALAGYVMQKWQHESFNVSNQGFLDNNMPYFSAPVDGTLAQPKVSGGINANTLHSILGRVFYSFKSKYMVTGTIRRDGSSKFTEDNKWGTFPAASAKWRISKESFWTNVPVINELAIKASYGKLGRESSIGPYQTVSRLSSAGYTFGGKSMGQGSRNPGYTITSYVNPGLIWEEDISQDYGIELGLWENKIFLTGNYYHKYTKGMLLGIPIPASVGAGGSITDNAGEILNKGIEFELFYKDNFGDVVFDAILTLARNKNEIINIGEGNILRSGEPIWDTENVLWSQAGGAFGDFYLVETDGIFQDPDQVADHSWTNPETGATKLIQPNAKPGDIRYVDFNDDGQIDDGDRQYYGNTFPKFEGGLNLNGGYKGFDLNLYFYWNYGNYVYNGGRYMFEGMTGIWNQSTAVLDRWTPDNPSTTMPRAIWNDPNKNTKAATDRFLEDGSFLKLKMLTLGYTLPSRLTSRSEFRILGSI
jgi:TonB-dependent starch-binding outer membrane protein SusC